MIILKGLSVCTCYVRSERRCEVQMCTRVRQVSFRLPCRFHSTVGAGTKPKSEGPLPHGTV